MTEQKEQDFMKPKLWKLLAGRREHLGRAPFRVRGLISLRRAKGSNVSFFIFNDNFMVPCCGFHRHQSRWRHLGGGALAADRSGRQNTQRSMLGRCSRGWGRTRNAGDMTGLSICMNDDGGAAGGLGRVDKI